MIIQHFVNNIECVLPSDFKFSLTEDNPEITNNGVFTLDITLSLKEPRNAIAFSHVNRLNTTHENKTIDSYFIIDGRKIMGTDVITSESDVSVSFQFVAGNSELKYLSQNEKKIYMLDWGTETAIDLARAINSITNWSWRNNFICVPVDAGGTILNEYKLDFSSITDNLIVMQPFLLYYINKLPELLGYTLKSNILETDDRAQRMYLVNPVDSLNYADCLPDMTISEFVKAIEDFFNVTFLVDSFDKTISIIRTIDDISKKKKVNIRPINGFLTEASDNDTGLKFGYTKIKYNLSSNDYFKFHQISDDILAKAEIVDFVMSHPAAADIDKKKIYRGIDASGHYNDWTYSETHDDDYNGDHFPLLGTPSYYAYMVNEYRAYGDSDDKILSLSVCPAQINRSSQAYLSGSSQWASYLLAVSSNDYQLPTDLSVYDQIAGQDSDITRNNTLEVAIYAGRMRVKISDNGTMSDYPFTMNDYPYAQPGVGWWAQIDQVPTIRNMRLVGDDGVVNTYRHSNVIDPSIIYKFTFVDSYDVNANNLFYCDGNNYMPITFEREIEIGKKNLVVGKFYRLL